MFSFDYNIKLFTQVTHLFRNDLNCVIAFLFSFIPPSKIVMHSRSAYL